MIQLLSERNNSGVVPSRAIFPNGHVVWEASGATMQLCEKISNSKADQMGWEQYHMTSKELAEAEPAGVRPRQCKFLLDENIRPEVADILQSKGLNVRDAEQEGLIGKDDSAVFQHARRTGRILLTHDTDYLDDRAFPEHSNPGVIILPGGHGNLDTLWRALYYTIEFFSRRPESWRKSKITVAAGGEITIRTRQDDGRMTDTRWRIGRDGLEIWRSD